MVGVGQHRPQHLSVEGVGVLVDEVGRVGLGRRADAARVLPIGADLGQRVEELGRVEGRRRSGPELAVARQQEAAPVLLAGAHGGAEGRRGRLPDARRGRRRRVGDVDRGGVEPVAGTLGEDQARLVLAGGDAVALVPSVGDPGQGRGQRRVERRLLARHLGNERVVKRRRERGSLETRAEAVPHRAVGGDPADRPGAALGDRLGEPGGGDRLVGEVEPLERQRLVRGWGRPTVADLPAGTVIA